MRGLLRPCRHRLGTDLHQRWLSHLCGGCLGLRDLSGEPARALIGYDTLLVSVLVESQSGPLATRRAGPCLLRGGATARVITVNEVGTRAVAAVSLLGGSAFLADKAVDDQVPVVLQRASTRLERRLALDGRRIAGQVGLDPSIILGAPQAATRAEHCGTTLDDFLAPTGDAVGAVFAYTASAAGCPGNHDALAAAGDAFGRLQHLLDAVDDLEADRRRSAFNPIIASQTTMIAAHAQATRLVERVAAALDQTTFVDPALVDALLRAELGHAVSRAFRPHEAASGEVVSRQPRGSGLFGAVAALAALSGIFRGSSPGPNGAGGQPGRHEYPSGPEFAGGYRRRRAGCLGSCCTSCACSACLNSCCCCCGDGGGIEVCCC